jgi:hypothetical protein
MTTTRTVTGILHHTPDTAWVGASVVFSLLSPFAVVGATYPPERVTATTDSNGAFSQALAVPASSADAARYRCELPNGIAFEFNLSTGVGSITLEALFIQTLTTATPNALQVLIDAHAIAAIHTFLNLTDTPDSYTSQGGKAVAVKTDVSGLEFVSVQPLDSDLTAIAALTTTAYGRSLLEAANAAALRTLAGLIIGTDVQAQDAELAALAGLVSAADKLPYFTGSGAAALADLTSVARSLLDDATTAAMLTTLGAATAIAEGRSKQGATTHLALPGVSLSGTVTTLAISANTVRYFPVLVRSAITVDQIAVEVQTNSAANTTIRLGIFNADTDWQPSGLVVDGGTVAADSNGFKAASVNTPLPVGRYLLALNSDAGPTLRSIRGGSQFVGFTSTLGASPYIFARTAVLAYGAFTGPGTAWSTAQPNSAPPDNVIFLRVSVP